MPKVTVDEYGDLGAGEDYVGTSGESAHMLEEPKALTMEFGA